MTVGRIVVVGAGGHAKVVIDCLRHQGWQIVGCTSAQPASATCAGVPVIGGDELLPGLLNDGVGHAFCAIGSNQARHAIGKKLLTMGFSLPSVVGPGAQLSPSASLGAGAIAMPGVVLNAEVRIGDLAIINTGATVDHDCDIGIAAHIGPGSSLAGEVKVGDRSFVATGCSIIPGRRIGSDTIVGAGSVVVRDLPDHVVAYGNPARPRRALA